MIRSSREIGVTATAIASEFIRLLQHRFPQPKHAEGIATMEADLRECIHMALLNMRQETMEHVLSMYLTKERK